MSLFIDTRDSVDYGVMLKGSVTLNVLHSRAQMEETYLLSIRRCGLAYNFKAS